jgi:hypothetical protein
MTDIRNAWSKADCWRSFYAHSRDIGAQKYAQSWLAPVRRPHCGRPS